MWRSKCRFLTTIGLVMTLTFDLYISKSNQFILVCTNIVNLVKFPQAVYKIFCLLRTERQSARMPEIKNVG